MNSKNALPPPSLRLLDNPGALCQMVRRIALEAGALIMEYFDDPDVFTPQSKQDGSPVTQADREAEALIERRLAEITPGIPVIGEEAAEEKRFPPLEESDYFWLVDPLDGTLEFIRGSGEFTVNIALIKGGVPILGVVYAPVTGILYAAHGEGTAVRWSEDTNKDKPIFVRQPPREGLTVVSSKGKGGAAEKRDRFLEQFKIAKIIQKGSSLKICAVAEGKADLYPRFGKTCEWDTAAGDAILRAAGGKITDMTGRELRYVGSAPDFLNPEFVASAFEWYESPDS